MKLLATALFMILILCPTITSAQGNRPRPPATPATLKAHLYMLAFKQSDAIEVTDVSVFKDIAACQAVAGNAKITMARDGGSGSALNVAFVCVEEQIE
jgi:hypothetical protein